MAECEVGIQNKECIGARSTCYVKECLIYNIYTNGFKLENNPEVAIENRLVATVLAFPNLSHFVNATAFVNDKDKLIETKSKCNNWIFKSAMNANTAHKTGCTYKRTQNTFESMGFMCLLGSAVSKTHTFSNSVRPS